MAKHVPIYLQLAPEQGGMRFGPFLQRFEIGSDPRRCQLVVDGRHGVFPQHAIAVQSEPGTLVVQPNGAQCQLFVIPNGQAHPWPVRAPVQVKHGDQIVLGTPAGPRFYVLADMSATKSASQVMSEARARGGDAGALAAMGTAMDRVFGAPSTGGIAGEVHRRSQAEFLRRSPWREIYQVWTRLKTGVLTNPRTVVGLGIALFGLLTTGGLTCSGALAAFYRVVMY